LAKVLLLREEVLLFSQVVTQEIEEHESVINDLLFDIYDFTEHEKQLVEDMSKYGIDFFRWMKQKSRKPDKIDAVRRPSTSILVDYANAFINTMTDLLKYQAQTMRAIVYQDGAPLTVVGFEVVDATKGKDVSVIEASSQLRNMLRHLDGLLQERQSPTLYMRRHVRIYDDTWLYLVRPSEGRFWTRSQARTDADGALIELLHQAKIGKE